MVRHVVLVRPRADADPGVWEHLTARLGDLVGALPGARTFRCGPNVTPEVGMDQGFSRAFVIDFDDAVARDAYLVDPEHVRIGQGLVELAEDGTEGIVVVDLEIEA